MPVDPLEHLLDENQTAPPPILVDEYIDVVKASDQWSDWRATLATQMYNEWKTNIGMSKRPAKSATRRILNGKLDCGQFKGGFYGECEKKIICAFPGTDLRAIPHIESKIKKWRKQYNLLQDMLKTSGFGWDDVDKIVLVDSDDVWDQYARREKDVRGMRNKSFPYYEDWLVLFGKDRATGDLAEGPADSVAAIETEEATKEQGPDSPVLQFSAADMESMSANIGTSSAHTSSNANSKKRGRAAYGTPKVLADMADAFGIMFENTNNRMAEIAQRIGYAHDLSQQRRQVNAELSQLPLDSNQRLRAATMIVQDAQRMDLFFSLSHDEKVE
ncbi:hypothetical protein Acr_05g0004200 [Actinidia rufa]|uniref:Myb/SANT-like domain-containing protein n=1 Tax=Actinidia rufa TaxID=165716 RepID=A0A7J0EJY8_9ERIC|nr:hypothetical protein Acr_05g0004200 [Actinidia rufa]